MSYEEKKVFSSSDVTSSQGLLGLSASVMTAPGLPLGVPSGRASGGGNVPSTINTSSASNQQYYDTSESLINLINTELSTVPVSLSSSVSTSVQLHQQSTQQGQPQQPSSPSTRPCDQLLLSLESCSPNSQQQPTAAATMTRLHPTPQHVQHPHHSHHQHHHQQQHHLTSPSSTLPPSGLTSLVSAPFLYRNRIENGSTGPFLRIVEEPTNRIRYRYKSEKGSHGGLTGENSSQNKKTYPTVKLENYRSSSQVYIKASLYTNDSTPKLHVHKLMGKHCNENGFCILPIGENNQAVFQNLGILFVGKKEVPEILYQRKLEEHKLICALSDGSQLSEADKERLREEADREAKRINLNCVKICFQAFDQSQGMNFPICDAVFSRPIANQKSPDSGELKIVRMDKYSGVCTGNEEVFLLCEKVNKKEIKIRFFEADMEGNQTWEAFANFTEADVHHQVAIVFRTPPYHNANIDRSVQVYAQLYRPKDGEYSEPRPFTYKPKPVDTEGVERKRKKMSTHFNSTAFGTISGGGGGGGDGVDEGGNGNGADNCQSGSGNNNGGSGSDQFPGFPGNGRYFIATGGPIGSQGPSNSSTEANDVNYYTN